MRRELLLLLALAAGASAGQAVAAPRAARGAADPCAAAARATDPTALLPFGCANAINLRLMLAEPRDLDRPAAPAPTAGDAAFAAVERRRLGRVKPLGAAVGPDAPASPPTEGR